MLKLGQSVHEVGIDGQDHTHLHRPSRSTAVYWTSTNDLAAIEVDIVD